MYCNNRTLLSPQLVKSNKDDIKIKEEKLETEEEVSELPVVENNKKRKWTDENTGNGIIVFDEQSASKKEDVPAKKRKKKAETADKIAKLEQEKVLNNLHVYNVNNIYISPKSIAISFMFQINHLRNLNRISITGTHVPKLILEFDELRTNYQVSEKLLNNMKACGYMYPTPIQKQAIPVMLEVNYNCYLYSNKVIKKAINNSFIHWRPTG